MKEQSNRSNKLKHSEQIVLSVLIPVYNEERTILTLLDRVNDIKLTDHAGIEIFLEIVLVNDASTDNTKEKVEEWLKNKPNVRMQIFTQSKNMGKGAALHKAIKLATGNWIIIQDADLEYDPKEYERLLEPALSGVADVVYGSRFMGSGPHRVLFFWHTIGNRFLTFLSNITTNLNLTDMETCYKLFRADILKNLNLREKRFGFEPEVTAKIGRVPGIRIYEVGISYYGRTFAEGKKINWRDGFRAIWCIFKYKFLQK